MRQFLLTLLLTLAFGGPWPARATACPTPESFVVPSGSLSATAAAIRARSLTILTLGGSATLGAPAHGSEFTYPSRLVARLRDKFPAVTIKSVVRAVPRESALDLHVRLDANLAGDKPALVIWGPGGSAAGRGEDLDTFIGDVTATVGKIRSAGADLILMTLQYAPSVARVVNLYPYRTAVIRAAETANVPVLDRYDLMRFWSDNGFLDLDATEAEDRVRVARKLYDCMAEVLADGIANAVR